jgi:hypothetical protein
MTTHDTRSPARSNRDRARDTERTGLASYQSPRLRVYGSVAELTRAHAASAVSDAGMNRMSPTPPS